MDRGFEHSSAFVETSSGLGTVAYSHARLLVELPVRVRVKAALTARRGWSSRPGAFTLTGAVHLPGLSAEFLFRRSPQEDRPADAEHRATATIVTAGHAIPFPPQSLSLRPAESDLCVRVTDPTHQPPWSEHLVGRCPGHPLTFDREFPVQAILDASFTPEESADGRGTRIEMAGEVRFLAGMTARLLWRAVGRQSATQAEADASEVVLLPTGTVVAIGRHAVWGLVGPNPWTSVRILDADGTMVGDEHSLGRSVRMP